MSRSATPGFVGRPRDPDVHLPPGQYLVHDFHVLSAGPTPRVGLDEWTFTVTTETRQRHTWSWDGLLRLPQEAPTVDIHCVTKWSKLHTTWRGVSVDTLLAEVESAEFVLVRSYGGYTTNLPLEDLLDGQAWVVHEFEGEPLAAAHGGPARLLVPHLYLWKSAKWVTGLELLTDDEPGCPGMSPASTSTCD